jgi:hypothetical protein
MKHYFFNPLKTITVKQRKQGVRQWDSGGCSFLPHIPVYAQIEMLDITRRPSHKINTIYNN